MHWWPRHTPSTGVPARRSRGSRRSRGRRPRAGPGRARSAPRRARARASRRASPRRGGARPARRPAHPGTGRGCRRTSRSCRSPARGGHVGRRIVAVAVSSAMPETKSKRSRYTPPPPKKAPPSKLWVPVAMYDAARRSGCSSWSLNYLNLLPGADTENRYLLLGLVADQRRLRHGDHLPLTSRLPAGDRIANV